MTEEELNSIIKRIFDFSGIKVSDPQLNSLRHYVEQTLSDAKISFSSYFSKLLPGNPFFNSLITQVTVNETYFFREHQQFDVLKECIFPKFTGKKINIWSGACSTGEEAISLLALAIHCGVDATLYATDIDEQVLLQLKKGIYSDYSFRNDGKKYHQILERFYKKENDKYIFDKDFISRINTAKFNLTQNDVFPFKEKMDIVFLRNVFIYFDKETRKKVTVMVASNMTEAGYLFFSLGEVGCLDNSIIPADLEKINTKDVYYFIHKTPKNTEISSVLTKIGSQNASLTGNSNSGGQKTYEQIMKEAKEKKALNDRLSKAVPAKTQNIASAGLEDKPKKQQFDAEKTLEQISDCINSGDFTKAIQITASITGSENKVYQHFFSGYIEYHNDNKTEAERYFANAEILQKDFWPAYFYHGLVLKDMGKNDKSAFYFNKCRALLDDFIGKNPYNFILDSFSPSYIRSLCQTLLNSE